MTTSIEASRFGAEANLNKGPVSSIDVKITQIIASWILPMAAAFEIVEMTMEHYPEVLQLWDATEGVMLVDCDTPQRAPDYFARNPGLSHVAIAQGQVVGAVLCGHDGRRGYLHHLAVAQAHRRQGIGRAIVNACLIALKHQSITACNLFIFDDNDSGKAFWAQNNWSQWPNLKIMTIRLDAE